MTRARRLARVLCCFAVASSVLAPLGARADAPVIASVEVSPDRLYANTPTRFGRGMAVFAGYAPGASAVEVTVTDDAEPPRALSTTVRTRGGAEVNFEGVLNVTDLGAHDADPTAAWQPNAPPVLDAPDDVAAAPGVPVTFSVTATDPDDDEPTIEAAGLPAGATFAEGSFLWTPAAAQAGPHIVVFVASDGRGRVAARGVRITVEGSSSPDAPPTLSGVSDVAADADQPVAFSMAATDPDGDATTIAAAGLPDGASFAAGSFSWTPAVEQVGMWDVVFVASDGRGAIDVETARITVTTPELLGRALLTFTFVARDAAGLASAPVVRTIEKFAATPGDTRRPIITVLGRPPVQWCAIVATKDGRCLDTSDQNSFLEFWPLRVAQVIPGTDPQVILDPEPTPRGETQIYGYVDDLTNSSLGIASEISSISVTIYNAEGRTWLEEHPILRAGPRGYFSMLLRINQFEPNEPGSPYRWFVRARDAWGHVADEVSGTFNVNAR